MSDEGRPKISDELLARIAKVTDKRPRTVLQHILDNGFVTTNDLKEKYGYSHPPRGAQDVRDQGITLKTTMVKGPDGRRMAAYSLVDDSTDSGKVGRKAFTKRFKKEMLAHYGARCAICNGQFAGRALQIDHRVPYQVAGDVLGDRDVQDYMLLCPSCNRSKSWSCEHCLNWQTLKDVVVCQTCMWGSPEGYTHIAMEERRNLTLSWEDAEVESYETLLQEANAAGIDVREYAKSRLKPPRLPD